MPRKTDSSNPGDWLWIAASDLELIQFAGTQEVGYAAARSKLAEVLEKVMKAELIRTGWALEKTHDLERLLEKMVVRGLDLVPQFAELCKALAEVYFTDRYPGYDFDDPDWPVLRAQIEQVTALHAAVQARLAVP